MKRAGSAANGGSPSKEPRRGSEVDDQGAAQAHGTPPGTGGGPPCPSGVPSVPKDAFSSPAYDVADTEVLSRSGSAFQVDSYEGSSNTASSSSPEFDSVWRLDNIMDEVLRAIFRLLLEQDLCRVAQVCRRFRDLVDDPLLWRRLYKEVFQYDQPLLHPQPCAFHFQSAEGGTGANPWKESFRQLYHGVHVRPRYQWRELHGRRITYFETVLSAVAFWKNHVSAVNASGHDALIFVHDAIYHEQIVIDFNVAIIGASTGDVNKAVILLSSESSSTLTFKKGADESYVGYLTLSFAPKPQVDSAFHEYCSLEILESCTPTVDSCFIQNESRYGSAVRVSGKGAKPTIQNCLITKCGNLGLCVEDHAEGTYEDNDISFIEKTCIWVDEEANPTFRRNVVHNGDGFGVKVCGKARGRFEEMEVFKIRYVPFEVTEGSCPVVSNCVLTSQEWYCFLIHAGASGLFTGNTLSSLNCSAVYLASSRELTFKFNKIQYSETGMYMVDVAKCIIEENEIFDCSFAGIQILNSHPIIRKNIIFHMRGYGILVSGSHASGEEERGGLIEENEIVCTGVSGMGFSNGSNMEVLRNRIHSGNYGVSFVSHGHGTLKGNHIFDNENYNLKIESGSNPSIIENKIWRGGNGGVIIHNKGLGHLEKNEIFDNGEIGLHIEGGSMPVVRFNKIFQGSGYGVCITSNAQASLWYNDILRNSDSGILISSESTVDLGRNRIFCGDAAGIDIVLGGNADLRDNIIFSNKFGGLNLASEVQLSSKRNEIFENENAVEEAVAKGLCFHALSGSGRSVMQDYHICRTCGDESESVCVSCIRVCHKGHDVAFVCRDKLFCDCGLGALNNPCQLQERMLSSPPAPPLSPAAYGEGIALGGPSSGAHP